MSRRRLVKLGEQSRQWEVSGDAQAQIYQIGMVAFNEPTKYAGEMKKKKWKAGQRSIQIEHICLRNQALPSKHANRNNTGIRAL